MTDIFRTGTRKQVFFRVGSFSDGSPRFAKAPFDQIIWGEGEVKTMMIDTLGLGGEENTEGLLGLTREQLNYRNEFGFLGESIVVEEHELGGDVEGWKGVHSFGLV
jgi:hypothetical protein